MSTPDQPGSAPGPVTLAAVIGALNDTVDELKATKAEVTALKAEARHLRTFGRHNRWLIAVDIVLTVLLSGVGALSVHAVQSAGHANSAQLALCQAGNVSRVQQIQLWGHVLDLSSRGPQTAQQRQTAAEFRAYLAKVFAPRDCNQLGR